MVSQTCLCFTRVQVFQPGDVLRRIPVEEVCRFEPDRQMLNWHDREATGSLESWTKAKLTNATHSSGRGI